MKQAEFEKMIRDLPIPTRPVSPDVLSFFTLYEKVQAINAPRGQKDWHTDDTAVAFVNALKDGQDVSEFDLSGVNLKGICLKGYDLSGVNFSGALLYDSIFEDCNLTQTNFNEAHLEKTTFVRCNLSHSTFKKSFMKSVLLEGNTIVDLEEKKKIDALNLIQKKIESGEIDLKSLSWEELKSLSLTKLDLSGIDLTGVDLSCFALEDLNLKGVYIDPKQLRALEGLLKNQERARIIQKKIKMAKRDALQIKNSQKRQTIAKQELTPEVRQVDDQHSSKVFQQERTK